MFKYKTFELLEGIAKISNTLLSSKIYVDSQSAMYSWYYEPDQIRRIVICRANGAIVGAAVLLKKQDKHFYGTNIGVFVKKDFRRQGIGMGLIKRLPPHKASRTQLMWTEGMEGSQEFYIEATHRFSTIHLTYAEEG